MTSKTNIDASATSSSANSFEDIPNSFGLRIHNAMGAFNMPLHIDLKRVAMFGANVDLDKSRGVLEIQLRIPCCLAKIYSSGRVTVNYCKSEDDCKKASRKIGRMIQRAMGKLNESICIRNLKVCNISASCKMPFGIKLEDLVLKHKQVYYEPELFPGAIWRFTDPKATFRIHTTGSITITGATSEANVEECLHKIYPILEEFASQTRLGNTVAVQEKEARKRRNVEKSYHAGSEMITSKKPRCRRHKQTDSISNGIHFSDEDEDKLEEHREDVESGDE